jgi:protein TonB
MREVSASVAAPDRNRDEGQSRGGYIAAVVVSALGHVGLFALVFFIAPRYLHQPDAPPPAYTVKIVDNVPAGDLGTHLPRINRNRPEESKAEPKPAEPKVKVEEPPKPELAPNDDKNALALNLKKLDTPTPEPAPEPTATRTEEETPTPTDTPAPTPASTKRPTAKPTPKESRHHKSVPPIVIAKAETKPSVAERLAALKRKNFEEHVKNVAKMAAAEKKNEDEGTDDDTDEGTDTPAGPSGGGPVAGKVATEGAGYGVGPGKGSEGILKDPEFLLYYNTVQEQIKKAWSFTGGSNDLTATVDFAIGPDGTLHNAKIDASSNDSAFDDSVIRAIRRAAPFPPPPDKFRDQFSEGIEAKFQLGELKS